MIHMYIITIVPVRERHTSETIGRPIIMGS